MVTRDFAFQSPDTIPAGLTTFHLVNKGPDYRQIAVVKLENGKSIGDFLQAAQVGGSPPQWISSRGGQGTPEPGAESNATLMLEPRNDVLACWIPAPDGTPHVMKGMVRQLTVVPTQSAPDPAKAAQADVTIRLADFDFSLSGRISRGHHVIRVENAGLQEHHILIGRPLPGKSLADVIQWERDREGPPPYPVLGGTANMEPGRSNLIAMAFEPGEYVLICFTLDPKDGKPHFTHGMAKQITVS